MQAVHLTQIDLNLLVGLDALLDLRSVTAAARRLGLSQSAMSHQLRRLRQLFDDPLLVSAKGGMVPTPRAEQLEVPVRRALGDLSRAVRGELAFDPSTAQRTFVIATKDVVEVLGLPPMLDLISREAPGIRVDVHPIGPLTATGLQEGYIDLVIGSDLEKSYGTKIPGLRTQEISNDENVCVMRRGHPAAADQLDLETYLSLRHIVFTPEVASDEPVMAELRKLGRERDIAARVSRFMTAPFAVAGSNLVVTLPLRVARHFAQSVPLVVAGLPTELESQGALCMSWHERYQEDPANQWLRDAAAQLTRIFDAESDHGAKPPAG